MKVGAVFKSERRLLVAQLLFIASLLAAVFSLQRLTAEAQSIIDISACQTISTSGSYRLSANFSGGSGCISIRADNVTLDGNGKTITVTNGTSIAVDVYDPESSLPASPLSNIDITNVTSNGMIRTFGDTITDVSITAVTVSGVDILGSDDVTVTGSTIGQEGIHANSADRPTWLVFRPTYTNNTIIGGSTTVKIMLEIEGGGGHPCPATNAIITNNTITSTRNDPPPEATAAVRLICAKGTTFTNNTVRSTGTTIGLYLRDEADNGTFSDNTFWTNSQEALRIATGNVDKTYPANNLFHGNMFRSDGSTPHYIQGIGPDNRFEYNVFWGEPSSFWIISGAFNNTFDHNTFYSRVTGSIFQLDYRSGPPADTWTNNIFSYTGSTVFDTDGWAYSRYIGNYNLFHNRAGSVSFPGSASLAAWRTATSGDDLQSIEADPLFVDAAAGDFRISASSPARGAGSSSSDIGAKPYDSDPPPVCTENWQCENWGVCQGGQQTRTCTDVNACGTTVNRPPLTQSCTCTENWQCSDWSTCQNSQQSRTCTDQNSCGTIVNRPPLTQSCTDPDTTPPAAVSDLR